MASAIRLVSRSSKAIFCRQWRGGLYRCMSDGTDQTLVTGNTEPPLPQYRERTGESIDLLRARLLYQSRKRGMLENGLLLSTFAGQKLDSLNEAQLKMYDALINKPTNDWEIYYWLTGVKEAPEEYNNEVLEMLKQHTRNADKEVRIRQPDLTFQ